MQGEKAEHFMKHSAWLICRKLMSRVEIDIINNGRGTSRFIFVHLCPYMVINCPSEILVVPII